MAAGRSKRLTWYPRKSVLLCGGRGTAKTTDVLADRGIDVIHDMPRAYSAFVANTYDDAAEEHCSLHAGGMDKKRLERRSSFCDR